ncbi:GNAT family N-acetyltransferase [Vibrio vulnificus]|uniref:GNAT family N-acetyltransferase n=2 Tax=Vibrio vulnificus TaxID=672 RepID=UPI004059C547
MNGQMIRIHKNNLPDNEQEVYEKLYSYFLDHEIDKLELSGDYWLISLSKKAFNHCDDIRPGLNWLKISERDSASFYIQGDRYLFCLAESYIPYGWSCLYYKYGLNNGSTVLLHFDSHRDLMDTRISYTDGEKWKDLLTNKVVQFSDPKSILSSVCSGAIGIGSMVTPLLHHNPNLYIAHYNPSVCENKLYVVKPELKKETLFRECLFVLKSKFIETNSKEPNNYIESNTIHDAVLFSRDKDNILLHIDMDSLNNRYNGNSDWESEGYYYENDIFSQISDIDTLISLIDEYKLANKIRHTSIGISPSFYPVEYWEPVTRYLLRALIKCGVDVDELYHKLFPLGLINNYISHVPDNIFLSETACNSKKKQRWNVLYKGVKAGKVVIEHDGLRASINVQLNKAHQGLGIGKYALHLACLASHHNVIEAVIRKNNVASMRSAIRAGFFELETKEKRSQRHMIWLRK